MFAITDIETTGGNSFTDKITEIAIYIHDGTRVIDEFSTLINPGRSIPPFVQNLTGITDDMVSAAPLFQDVAEEIRRFTEPYIFVAHSSHFDYSFIRQEFKSIGYNFMRPSLCTVSFSRRLMPGHNSYGLSALCQRLNIENVNRHRAGGDAFATVRLFETLMENGGRDVYASIIQEPQEEITIPDCIRPEVMNTLPNRPGIFYFLNKNDEILFIGRGHNIRKSVLTFITKTRHKKSFRIREELHDIRFEETGNEVLASVLEYYEWKKFQPRYNSRQNKTPFIRGVNATSGYLVLRGRKDEEEVFFRLEQGKLTGFNYITSDNQAQVEDLMITLPYDPYTTALVQKAISRKYYSRLINTGL